MKAVVCEAYGAPEVLKVKELPRPVLSDSDVLVELVCSNVNIGDVRIRKADPWAVRLIFGWNKPKQCVLGGSFAGKIVEVGQNVRNWKVGDRVFGTTELRFGTYAEFVVLNQNALFTSMPKVSFESASSSVFGTTTALGFLQKAKINAGDKVLIYGASGSVGSAAVQLAKSFGAHVTAVCGPNNAEAVALLGADLVLNYENMQWEQLLGQFDLVYEAVNKLPFKMCKRLLKRNGSLILGAADFNTILKGSFLQLYSKHRVYKGMIKPKKEDIQIIANLLETGNLTPLIDRSYALDQIQMAHRYVELGHKRGNVVLEINESTS